MNCSQYSYDMENTKEDSDDSSSDTVCDSHSDDEPTKSINQERVSTRSKKQRLRDPAKGATPKKFPKIMNKVKHVLEDKSKHKKKGRNRTILVFYYRKNEKKKQSSKKEKTEVPKEVHTSNNDSSLPGTSQDTEPSGLSLPKRVRKWFFL